jgi:hypothetical protein
MSVSRHKLLERVVADRTQIRKVDPQQHEKAVASLAQLDLVLDTTQISEHSAADTRSPSL